MKKNVIASLGMIAAIALTTGCGGNKKTETQEETQAVRVRVEKAVLRPVEQRAEFTSNIEAYKSNNIAPSMPLRIDNIMAEVGQTVSNGQMLVVMDPANYNQVMVQMANLEADYNRLNRVYQAGGISKQTLDQTATQLEVMRTQAANLNANTHLRSPIDGVVTARNYDAGDMYNGAQPILTVMQINTLKVTLSLAERFFPMIRQGMEARIRVDMFPDKVYEGKISLVYPAVDPATRTFMIEVSIPNPGKELRPGMFSRTTLNFGTQEGIMIRDIAIQRQLGTNDRHVFVAVDGKAERRQVVVGMQEGAMVEILSGVNEGDMVITEGISRLMQGTGIEIVN